MKAESELIRKHLPSNEEFEILEELITLLGPLKDLTNLLSRSEYVTANIIYPVIHSLINSEFPIFF